MSIQVIMCFIYAPRDDLNEAGYVMAELLTGTLPWAGIGRGLDKDFKLMEYLTSKITTPTEVSVFLVIKSINLNLNHD